MLYALQAAEHVANTIEAAHPDKPRPDVTALAKARNDIMVIPTATGDQLVRPCHPINAPQCSRRWEFPVTIQVTMWIDQGHNVLIRLLPLCSSACYDGRMLHVLEALA